MWCVCGPVLGGITAWLAQGAQVDLHFAPLILFPLLVGVVLGAMIVGLMRLAQVGHRPTVIVGIVLAVAVAVVGQHYLTFRESRQRALQDQETFLKAKRAFGDLVKGRAPKPPAHLLEYMQRQAKQGRTLWYRRSAEGDKLDIDRKGLTVQGGWAWATWIFDGLLTLVATLAIVVPAARLPYCNQCRSWYSVIRSGRIDAALARRLAEAAGVEVPENVRTARYRIACCREGCGATRLHVAWQHVGGPTTLDRVWLDKPQHNRVTAVLDEGSRDEERETSEEESSGKG